jgi:hypothetical protein
MLAGVLGDGVGGAHAALPPAPFALSAWPPTTQEGGELALQLRAREAPDVDTQVDLYVAVIQDGKFSGAFLTPEGTWAADPEPYRQRIALADLHGLTLRFRRVNPAGWFTFRLYFLRPSAEKLNRKHYVRQPLDVTVRIEAATPATPRDRLVLAGLAALTLAAWTIVFRYPRRRPGSPTSPPCAPV